MITTSDRFAEVILSGPYTLSTRATLREVRSGLSYELPILDGSVSLDADAATLGSLDLTIANDATDNWVPDATNDLLAPYGNEIVVELGADYGDGTIERVSSGVFRVDETTSTSEAGELQVQVSGLDRSSVAIDAVFESAGQVAAGDDAAEAIEALLEIAFAGVGGVSYSPDWGLVTGSLPALSYEVGQDRWDFCRGLAEAAGAYLFFDHVGQLCMRHIPPSETPLWTVSEGEGGALISASKRWGREDACNRVVVYGENTSGDPFSGEAKDSDPTSPTRYGGPFGMVTFPFTSEWITSDTHAEYVAGVILGQKRGTGQQIDFTSLLNPALQPFDTVKVVREELGVNEIHVIDQVTLPLTREGDMSCQTRMLRIV